MTAAYEIATEHAILAEASAAGNLRALPAALLFGVLLGALYDLFRMLSSALGVREESPADGGRLRKWILWLRQYRCRALPRRKQAVDGDEDGRNKRSHHRLPARVVQAMLDILYFLLCGVLGAVFLYWRNSGILRWYLILGGAIGFFIYYAAYAYLLAQFLKYRKYQGKAFSIVLTVLIVFLIMDYGRVSYYQKQHYIYLLLYFCELAYMKKEARKAKTKAVEE